jgi:hypothetical protein
MRPQLENVGLADWGWQSASDVLSYTTNLLLISVQTYMRSQVVLILSIDPLGGINQRTYSGH